MSNAYNGNHENQAPGNRGQRPLETLYESGELVIWEGLPVALESVSLMADRGRDKLLARCIFKSISHEPIGALLVEITCVDVWGNTLGEPVSFQYLDLRTKRETKFGQTEPVEIPDKNTRRLQVSVKKVLMADGRVLTGSDERVTMPAPVLLRDHLGSAELAEQYGRETVPKAQFVPQYGDAYWRCACGALNGAGEEVCCQCGCAKEKLTAALSVESLRAGMERRKAEEEKARAEQAERIRRAEEQVKQDQERRAAQLRAAEEEKEKKKRKTRLGIILSAAAVLVAALTVFALVFGIPYYHYRLACEALKNGKYDEAYTAFMELDGFSDSKQKAVEAVYRKAVALMNNKQYGQAIAEFEKISSYKDAAGQIREAEYQLACAALKQEAYVDAAGRFDALGDYKDSRDKANDARYAYVCANKKREDETTYAYLLQLKEADYIGAEPTYKELYGWKVVVHGWSDSPTEVKTSVGLKAPDKAYCYVTVEGGPPGETTKVKCAVNSPGYDRTFSMGERSSGESAWVFVHDGGNGLGGTITIRFYDGEGNQIGRCGAWYSD